MSKRKRFILSSIILSLGFVGIQFVPDDLRIMSILGLSLLTLLSFVWSLWEGLGWNMTLSALILPIYFTFGVGFFWFLLPTTIVARVPIVILYGLGIYALSLTLNIYTVSTIRTIALIRAAKGVGLVLSLLTLFLIFDTILSFRWPIYVMSISVFCLSFPLFLQGFWSVDLKSKLSMKLIMLSLISALATSEIALIMFFWPVGVIVGSLFLTTASYTLLGLGQAEVEGKLFSQTIREYLTLGLAVLIGMFFATHWA